MNDSVLRLYPQPSQEYPLVGLYLNHDLGQYSQSSGTPFVYSNFVTSLDGRIAIPHPTKPGMMVPDQTANPRDWRLFQELAVQADLLITSGRYLRDYADGRAQEILRVYDDPEFADLKAWRLAQGLPLYPDLAVISASLDFPIPAALTRDNRSVVVFTTSQADAERVRLKEAQLAKVLVAGDETVDGNRLIDLLGKLGYGTIYSATGPKVLHLLLAAGRLDRLYLTYTNRILGGRPFSSIVEGDLLPTPYDFRLASLYLDPHALDGIGQLFAGYHHM